MRLIGLAVILTLSLILAPLTADAQPSTTIPRMGLLAPDARSWEPLRIGLRDLGYVEGKSIALEERSSQGRNERLSDLASGLVRLNLNLIVTWGTPAPLAPKQATKSIPITTPGPGDPVSRGLVSSPAHPGGRVRGFA